MGSPLNANGSSSSLILSLAIKSSRKASISKLTYRLANNALELLGNESQSIERVVGERRSKVYGACFEYSSEHESSFIRLLVDYNPVFSSGIVVDKQSVPHYDVIRLPAQTQYEAMGKGTVVSPDAHNEDAVMDRLNCIFQAFQSFEQTMLGRLDQMEQQVNHNSLRLTRLENNRHYHESISSGQNENRAEV